MLVQIEQDLSVRACGDGVIDPGEFCDDMNLLPDDGCSPQCMPEGDYRYGLRIHPIFREYILYTCRDLHIQPRCKDFCFQCFCVFILPLELLVCFINIQTIIHAQVLRAAERMPQCVHGICRSQLKNCHQQ